MVNVCTIYSVLKFKVKVNIDNADNKFSVVDDDLWTNKNSNIKLLDWLMNTSHYHFHFYQSILISVTNMNEKEYWLELKKDKQ